MRGNSHVRFGGRRRGNRPAKAGHGASPSTPTSQRPALPDGRRRSRQRPTGLGGGRPGPQDRRGVLRRLGRGALQADRACVLRHGRLDRRAGRRPAPRRGALRGPVSCRDARDRRAGRGSPRGLERRPQGRRDRRRPRSEGRAVRAVEEASPTARPQSSRASRRPPLRCTARTCSRSNSDRSTGRPAKQAIRLLDEWIAWARRCRLPAFAKLARTITAQRAGIIAAIEHRLSNARVDAINTQIRMITRRAYGFHSPAALIALAMLSLSGLCPPLPR